VNDDTDPFVFPDMPDEAVAAIDQFLEASTTASKITISLKCIAGTTHSMSAKPTAGCHQPYRSQIRRSDQAGDRDEIAAVTIADRPSPIVNIRPSN
jgi:hypothetical protein